MKECRIAIKDSCDALDLKVSTVPFDYQGEQFTICGLQDISHEKRRRALERTFFHDVLNTAGGLRGFVELLLESEPEEVPEVAGTVNKISRQLIDEIEAQRSLLAAESNQLSVNLVELEHQGDPRGAGGGLPAPRGGRGQEDRDRRRLRECATFRSDQTLLQRILGNMLKNALEATSAEEKVTLGARGDGNRIELWVQNPGFMPREVQLQVFNRSFSTKGAGRGIGTYSMRLLASKYLGGTVDFTTSEAGGTTFRVRLTRAN